MTRTLRIATRKSPLALWQAEHVAEALGRHHPDLKVELVAMTTRGDKLLDAPLAKVGGKGLFVKELEQAMLEGRADLAVHSMKDVPMEFPPGLELAIIMERDDPRDAFVSPRYENVDALPQGARVGTSSLRRGTQLRSLRPDLQILNLRGNVQTRLRKLDDGEFDAIILAAAGLRRLALHSRIRSLLAPEQCLPAGGQGAVGVEIRSDDQELAELLAPLHHVPTALKVRAERALNRRLEGGCQVPIACHAVLETPDRLWLRGLVGEPDGSVVLTAEARGSAQQPEELGVQVAEDLLGQGAGAILERVYRAAESGSD